MSTPSRVTRSSSRQPERSPRARTPARSSSGASSSSKKKSSSSAAASSSNKKTAPTSSNKKSSSSSSSNKKKSSSSAAEDVADSARKVVSSAKAQATKARDAAEDFAEDAKAAVSRTSSRASGATERVRSTVEEYAHEVVSRTSSRTSSLGRGARQLADDAFNTGRQTVTKAVRAAENEATGMPAVAIVPQVALYAAIVGIAHILVLFFFAKESLQGKLIDFLSRLTGGLLGSHSIKQWLSTSNEHSIALWLVVPAYLAAGILLRQGVRNVFGKRQQALAANIARVVSAVLFVLTVAGYTEWDQYNSYEGMNALSVLQFAFMLQEFLLNFPRFSGARFAYSVGYLLVTGCLSVRAYEFRPTVLTSPQAPVLIVALSYALFVVNTSDNLAALAGASASLGLPRLSVVYTALQSVVNYAVLPIMAISIYQKHGALFPSPSEKKQPDFIESSIATAVMVALTFLLIVDSHQVPVTRVKNSHKARKAQ